MRKKSEPPSKIPRARRLVYALPLALSLALLASVVVAPFGRDRGHPPSRRERFAVASENALATRIGMEALRDGATAVDAAITMAFVLGVVQPESSGIGGGGFGLVWDAKNRRMTALDFREAAPAHVNPTALEERPKKPRAAGRGRMIGVPGEVAGLLELHRGFGARSLSDDLAPAVRVAEGGFAATRHLAQFALAYHEELDWSEELRALYKPGGWAVGAGGLVRNAALGRTLRRIAAEGTSAFYEGGVAAEIARAGQATGGTITEADLTAYRPIEREPLTFSWEGRSIFTMPPPSGGGLLLAETLGMFSSRELLALGLGSGAYDHVLAEAFRGATADRMQRIGDPEFSPADLGELLATSRLRDRRERIALDRARAVPRFALEEHGTSHLAVVDADGNIASLTLTVNDGFGAFVSTESTGVLLNDELADFTTYAVDRLFRPDGAGPNRPRPFARPASSMTPTIVFREGRPEVVVGGSGGLRIATGVAQTLLANLVFGLAPGACVAATRFHTPTDGPAADAPVLELDETASEGLVRDLRARGELVRLLPNYSGIQMIALTRAPDGGLHLTAAADPRKGGTALVE